MTERDLLGVVAPWFRLLLSVVLVVLVVCACWLSLSGHLWSVVVYLVAARIIAGRV